MIASRGSAVSMLATPLVLEQTRVAIAESRAVLGIARRLSAETTARVIVSLEHLVESEIRVAHRRAPDV